MIWMLLLVVMLVLIVMFTLILLLMMNVMLELVSNVGVGVEVGVVVVDVESVQGGDQRTRAWASTSELGLGSCGTFAWRLGIEMGLFSSLPRAPLDDPLFGFTQGVGPLQSLAPSFVPIGFRLLVTRAPPQLACRSEAWRRAAT